MRRIEGEKAAEPVRSDYRVSVARCSGGSCHPGREPPSHGSRPPRALGRTGGRGRGTCYDDFAGARCLLTRRGSILPSGEPFVSFNEATIACNDDPDVMRALQTLHQDSKRQNAMAVIQGMANAAGIGKHLDSALMARPFTPRTNTLPFDRPNGHAVGGSQELCCGRSTDEKGASLRSPVYARPRSRAAFGYSRHQGRACVPAKGSNSLGVSGPSLHGEKRGPRKRRRWHCDN